MTMLTMHSLVTQSETPVPGGGTRWQTHARPTLIVGLIEDSTVVNPEDLYHSRRSVPAQFGWVGTALLFIAIRASRVWKGIPLSTFEYFGVSLWTFILALVLAQWKKPQGITQVISVYVPDHPPPPPLLNSPPSSFLHQIKRNLLLGAFGMDRERQHNWQDNISVAYQRPLLSPGGTQMSFPQTEGVLVMVSLGVLMMNKVLLTPAGKALATGFEQWLWAWCLLVMETSIRLVLGSIILSGVAFFLINLQLSRFVVYWHIQALALAAYSIAKITVVALVFLSLRGVLSVSEGQSDVPEAVLIALVDISMLIRK
jgi:hypothetical protein